MNAIFLLAPILFIRYVLLYIFDKDALRRAAFFPPLLGREKTAFLIYQVSNAAMFVYLFFLSVNADSPFFYAGLLLYALGTALYGISVWSFAKPHRNGFSRKGLYRFSRNPMYVGYFICFTGCALLTRSVVLFLLLAAFQISSHFIILAEERWCKKEFGEEYMRYMKAVRRYI